MVATDTTLQHLADRAEITDLVHRLGAVLDDGRFEEMRDLVVEDVKVRTGGGEAAGADAAIAQASRNHRPDQPIQHLVTNLTVDLDGADRASVRANLVVHFGAAPGTASENGNGGSRSPIAPPVEGSVGGVYRFGLVRTPGGWRFDRVDATALWTSGTLPVG